MGELVEIASCCAWGDETFSNAAQSDLPGLSFGPRELCGFSVEQTGDRAFWNTHIEGLDWIPEAADPAHPIDWMRADCLFTGQAIFVPADFVLIGRRAPGDAAASAVADTNGCAAGETIKDARLRALFELIERDATGRWWYGQRNAPVLGPSAFSIESRIVEHFGRRGRHPVLLDITSDLGVPTVAALAMDATGGHLAAGFATRANLRAAGRAAVSELMQMELRIAAAQSSPLADENLATWFHEVRFEGGAPFQASSRQESPVRPETDVDLDACIARLAAAGCRVAMMDFTRPEFDVPVMRAVSPDLCHWKPRFGRARLLESERPAGDGRAGPATARNPWLLRI